VLTVLNKSDAVRTDERSRLTADMPEARWISALRGDGVEELLAELATHLPESPYLYPEDEVSTQSVRFFVAELVRETALEQLEEEVPYSVACEVEEFREDRMPVYIRAVLYVERESQKRILIGHQGSRIRDIGRAARAKILRTRARFSKASLSDQNRISCEEGCGGRDAEHACYIRLAALAVGYSRSVTRQQVCPRNCDIEFVPGED